MRPLSACLACRNRRKKCHQVRRGASCSFCIKRNLKCSASRQPAQSASRAYEPLISRREGNAVHIPSQELSEELVDLYFRHIHISFPNIFHPPSFRAAVRDGSVPTILFFGVIALSARFSSHQSLAHIDPWVRGRPHAREAEKLLNLHDTSLTTIQACILLAASCIAEGEPGPESVYYAIACRIGLFIDLPNVPAGSEIEREVNRRVWWTLITSDTWISSALCLPRTIEPTDEVPMPMAESDFSQLEHDSFSDSPSVDISSSPAEDPCFSVLAHMIRLNRLLNEINKLNVRFVTEQPNTDMAENLIRNYSRRLDKWVSELPHRLRFTEANLRFWAEQGSGPIFISLHINYNHIGQLLFFQFLHLSGESVDLDTTITPLLDYARKCKWHAANVCNITSKAKARPDTNVLYSMLGHVLVLASTSQIHTVLFSLDDDEISVAKSRLESNFEILTTLYTYWPIVSTSLGRLRAFHNACLKSRSTSFRLDQWMLQFMQEFSKPIEERNEEFDIQDRNSLALDSLRHSMTT